MEIANSFLQRTELLLGTDFVEKAKHTKLIIFGLGGVGSWCAESLVRSGIGSICLVDYDFVNASNVNRQLIATSKTIGKAKVDVLKDRLIEINPKLDINTIQKRYSLETHNTFNISSYDYIIDAIDSVPDKVNLIQQATQINSVFFSSMGAASKIDTEKIRIADFWDVQGCPLASKLRKIIRKSGGLQKSFLCVYSNENFKYSDISCETNNIEKHINGTTSYIPPIFGLKLSGLVVKDLLSKI